MTTKVYGCSDDLVEFEGDINVEVEHYQFYITPPAFFLCSDGTVFSADYEGIWKLEVLKQGSLFSHLEKCLEETDDNYSDHLYFKDGLTWIKSCTDWRYVQ